jgi:hypothetical protein
MSKYRKPLFFFHLHKAGGTTFINLAQANGHKFAGNRGIGGMPTKEIEGCFAPCDRDLPSRKVHLREEAFTPGARQTELWQFWENTNDPCDAITKCVEAGVDFFSQEWGQYNKKLFEGFYKAIVIRHPIDVLYSNFCHQREDGHIPMISFEDWFMGQSEFETSLHNQMTSQLGDGDKKYAARNVASFDAVIRQDKYRQEIKKMEEYGWMETDSDYHFKSWTAKNLMTGRNYIDGLPKKVQAAIKDALSSDIYVWDFLTKE